MTHGAAPALPRRRRIAFALVPSLAALFVLEIGARVCEALLPASRDVADFDVAEIRRRKNAGALARRAGERLVFVYGESTVWGMPCPEVGLVAQLQFQASGAAPAQPVRFVNLGVRSADSAIVRSVVEETIDAKPDLAIVLCGHNEFLRPDSRAFEAPGVLRHLALARTAAMAASRVSNGLEARGVPGGFSLPVPRDDSFRRAERRYRRHMTAIVETVQDADVPVLVAAPSSNLRDWPPVFRRLHGSPDGYEETMETGLAAADAGDAAALRSVVDGWQARLPDDAMVRYLRGRLRRLGGDDTGALGDFRSARDLDPIPFRMTTAFMGELRDVALSAGAQFVDLEAVPDSGAVPGLDLFADNCHPSPDGGMRMAAALLHRAGLLPDSAAEPSLDAFLRAAGCTNGSELRLRYLVANGRYAMQPPLHHYPIAHRYFVTAVVEYAGSWFAHANLATLHLFAGDVEAGERELALAEKLHGGPLPLTDREALPNLAEVMEMRGLR